MRIKVTSLAYSNAKNPVTNVPGSDPLTHICLCVILIVRLRAGEALCPVRLGVRTPPFHGGNTGSNPVPDTIFFWQFCILLDRIRSQPSEFFIFGNLMLKRFLYISIVTAFC